MGLRKLEEVELVESRDGKKRKLELEEMRKMTRMRRKWRREELRVMMRKERELVGEGKWFLLGESQSIEYRREDSTFGGAASTLHSHLKAEVSRSSARAPTSDPKFSPLPLSAMLILRCFSLFSNFPTVIRLRQCFYYLQQLIYY